MLTKLYFIDFCLNYEFLKMYQVSEVMSIGERERENEKKRKSKEDY